MKNIQKVIIIGAPRSGTNILRDVLTSLMVCVRGLVMRSTIFAPW